MRADHKVMAGISIVVFTLFVQVYMLTNYLMFPTVSVFNKIFMLVFPILFLFFFYITLSESRMEVKTTLKIFTIFVIANISLSVVLIKYTDLENLYISGEYASLNDEFLKANPAVVNLDGYKKFKSGMANLDVQILSDTKEDRHNIKSVDEYLSDVVRLTIKGSEIPELKAQLAEIDRDNYITVNEYHKFIQTVKTMPKTKETTILKNIYSKLR